MSDITFWKSYWEKQSTPLHRYNDEHWYRMYAEEINLIAKSLGYQGGSVMETGCGNGALFDYLDIDKEKYVGTDISENMLNIFRNKHPELNLVCTDSSSYFCDQKFAMIFSNGVVQYFDDKRMELYIENSLKMLNPNGLMLLGNIPWKDLRKKNLSGELSAQSVIHSLPRLLKIYLYDFYITVSGKDPMGHWYNPRDFFKYRSKEVEIHVLGSLFHPYRFSLVLKKVISRK